MIYEKPVGYESSLRRGSYRLDWNGGNSHGDFSAQLTTPCGDRNHVGCNGHVFEIEYKMFFGAHDVMAAATRDVGNIGRIMSELTSDLKPVKFIQTEGD